MRISKSELGIISLSNNSILVDKAGLDGMVRLGLDGHSFVRLKIVDDELSLQVLLCSVSQLEPSVIQQAFSVQVQWFNGHEGRL